MSWRHLPAVLSLSITVICVPHPRVHACLGRVCIRKLYTHRCVYVRTYVRTYDKPIFVSSVRRQTEKAHAATHAGVRLRAPSCVADMGWLMEKLSPQRKPPLRFSSLSLLLCLLFLLSLAVNRGRSPSLFRVYLMWIAPRTAVARDSVPPGRPGPIRNFAGCIGRGSESWRRWHVWPVPGSPLESLGFRIALCVVDPSVIATSTIGIQTGTFEREHLQNREV